MKRIVVNRRGVTLVELMIVVAILAILASVIVPTIYDYRVDKAGTDAARDITQQLRGLRSLAAATNRAMTVYVTPGDAAAGSTSRGKINVFPSANNACIQPLVTATPDPNLSLDMTAIFPDDNLQIVKVSPSTGDSPHLAFCIKPDGRVVNLSTRQPLFPDANSSSVCTGDAYAEVAGSKNWATYCNKPGVICMKVAYINDACPDACLKFCDSTPSHFGADHIITMTFSGETRMVQ